MDDVLTLKTVFCLGACVEAVDAFEEHFGSEAEITDVIAWLRKIGRPDWEAWILSQELPITEAFVRCGANVNAFNGEALANASFYGKVEIVKFLLDNGADIHALGDVAWLSGLKRRL